MRFIHTSDVHLGAEPEGGPIPGTVRARELWSTFEKIIQACEEEQADLLFISGDLFHRQPLLRELKEVNYLFAGLSRTKVVLIAGNHDYIREDSYYRSFEWSENVYTLFGEETEYILFPELKTAVYGFSYHRKEITEPLYDRIRPVNAAPIEILVAHGGDGRHIPIDFRLLKNSGFDYVALGHIHRPGAVSRDCIVYPGAPEPVDINDTGAHGYIIGEVTGQGAKVRWIPAACREYVHLTVKTDRTDTNGSLINKIEKLISEKGNQNIYKIVIKGKKSPEIIFDQARIHETGNIVSVSDETVAAYDFEKLYRKNRDTVLGRFIACFGECEEGSTEYRALSEGVDALMESRRH